MQNQKPQMYTGNMYKAEGIQGQAGVSVLFSWMNYCIIHGLVRWGSWGTFDEGYMRSS